MAVSAEMGSTMSENGAPSDLSSDPRNAQDRLRAQQPLEYPGPSIPVLGWDMATAVAAAVAAIIAIAIGLWLGGRSRKKSVPSIVPSVNRAELAFEFAPVALKLLQSPAIRAYALRMVMKSLARKLPG